ncbi:MAG: OmpA family protein [Bacteroidetes bacterium]|nr:MAG: OmpA family protein [Bacteroidota bacterium]
MKKFAILVTILFGAGMAATAQDLPANPEENSCYVRCVTPDEFKTEEVRVMVRPEYKRLTIVPAEYKEVTERVLVKEASVRYEFSPAEYKTEYVNYDSKDGFNKLAITPASFGDGEEVIEIYPKVTRWESQLYEGCESDNPADCQVWCFRAYDAQTTTVGIKTLDNDASTSPTSVDGETARYAKQVVAKPAEVREIQIPAEYKEITKTVLVKDETVVEEIVEAEYTTVTKTVLVKKGGTTEYRPIDCELLEYNVLPINFNLGSAALTSTARSIIDKNLLKLMVDNPGTKIEISAHTDSRGSKDSNKDLSSRRAKSVVDYLVSKGISPDRLVSKGYGEERLKNKCSDGVSCTEAEHAVNRRVEFRVLNY